MPRQSGVLRLSKCPVLDSWLKHEASLSGVRINPAALTTGDGTFYTLVSPDGVRIALSNRDLYTRPERAGVYWGDGIKVQPNDATVAGIVTPAEHRRQGFADKALADLCVAASWAGIRLSLEPRRMTQFGGERIPSDHRLVRWYRRHGFEPAEAGSFAIMRRLWDPGR